MGGARAPPLATLLDAPKTCDSEVFLSDFFHARSRAAMIEWLKVKPKTCVQLSSWPSHLSNQNFIESSILIFSFD